MNYKPVYITYTCCCGFKFVWTVLYMARHQHSGTWYKMEPRVFKPEDVLTKEVLPDYFQDDTKWYLP